MTTESKIKRNSRLANLIEFLASGNELDQNDAELAKKHGLSLRTIQRDLDLLRQADNKVLSYKKKVKNQTRTFYRVLQKKDIEEILAYYLDENFEEILKLLKNNNKFLNTYIENNPALKKQKKQDIFFFKNQPFEDLENEKIADYINILKVAVENQAYKKFTLSYKNEIEIKEFQCLRLIHVDNNWYLFVKQENNEAESEGRKQGKFRFIRLAFVKNIEDSNKENKKENIKKELDFIQNSMTLFNIDKDGKYQKKTIRLLALKQATKYFKKDISKKITSDENMRKFFPSQKFLKENKDGSLEFSVDYTQYIELSPFIKSFLPYIQIAKFKDEKEKEEHKNFLDQFKKDLQEMQKNLEKGERK